MAIKIRKMISERWNPGGGGGDGDGGSGSGSGAMRSKEERVAGKGMAGRRRDALLWPVAVTQQAWPYPALFVCTKQPVRTTPTRYGSITGAHLLSTIRLHPPQSPLSIYFASTAKDQAKLAFTVLIS